MKYNKSLLFILLIFVIGGCGTQDKTVDYYKKHEKERMEKIKYCKNSAERRMEIECKNAFIAHARQSIKKSLERKPYK